MTAGEAATSAADVALRAARSRTLVELDQELTTCRACPRLVEWREQVARNKRRAFEREPYWGRPVPGFGSTTPLILVVGLAPAAHGGNRTGRVFTGDRSGDWLFAAMHRCGLANQPTSTALDDGLELINTRVLAAVRCAPPANKPTTTERDTCAPWLDRELALVRPRLRVIVALGAFGWSSTLAMLARSGEPLPVPRPRFAHGAEVLVGAVSVLGCFHPSQQNTFTGRLTEPMLDAVLRRARIVAGGGAGQ